MLNMQKIYRQIILILALIFISSISVFSQIFDKTKGKNLIKLLSQTTTVYTDAKGPYTDRLKNAFTEYWKISPFEFRDVSNGLLPIESQSPVFAPGVVMVKIRDHETSQNYPFFIYGVAGNTGKLSGEGIVAAFPVNAFHYEFDVLANNMFNRSLLRLPYIVYNLNDMLTFLKAKDDPNDYYKSIEVKSPRMAKKTMLIPKEFTMEWDVNPNTTAFMKANMEAGKKSMKAIMVSMLDPSDISFGGKYKILSTAEIMKLEESADADKYTLFMPAIDNKKYIMVYDLKTKELLYFDGVTMSMKIKGKDFDKLNKAAGF